MLATTSVVSLLIGYIRRYRTLFSETKKRCDMFGEISWPRGNRHPLGIAYSDSYVGGRVDKSRQDNIAGDVAVALSCKDRISLSAIVVKLPLLVFGQLRLENVCTHLGLGCAYLLSSILEYNSPRVDSTGEPANHNLCGAKRERIHSGRRQGARGPRSPDHFPSRSRVSESSSCGKRAVTCTHERKRGDEAAEGGEQAPKRR